jgi:hypothetical protein
LFLSDFSLTCRDILIKELEDSDRKIIDKWQKMEKRYGFG